MNRRIDEIRHAIRRMQEELPPHARATGVDLAAWQDEAEAIYRLCRSHAERCLPSPYARESTLLRDNKGLRKGREWRCR